VIIGISAMGTENIGRDKIAYEIEFITDSRFKGTKQKLVAMDKRLKKEINKFGGCVSLKEVSGIRELNFSMGPDPASKSWRKKYHISKSCAKPTWNDVMHRINKIQAPYYKRI
jgi:hypothetical protein